MRLTTQEIIDAPIEQVFDVLCRFEEYEKLAIERGVDLHRRNSAAPLGSGTIWDCRLHVLGQERAVRLEVVDLKAPDKISIDMTLKGYSGSVIADFLALSTRCTRLDCVVVLRADTLKSRIALKSATLAQPALEEKFRGRFRSFADELRNRVSNAG